MKQVTIELTDESLLALRGVSEENMASYLTMAAGAKLFEMGALSSGAAAQLAGLPRSVFLEKLADYGVDTFKLSLEELKRETRLA